VAGGPRLRPDRPSPGRIVLRRALAIVAVALAVGVGVWAVLAALPHVKREVEATPAVTLPLPPKPFRVIFPEGFTRAQMADRVEAVSKIAERKSGKPVKLSRAAYATGSRTGTVSCFTPKKRTNLEGFLFPATYDFLAKTTSKQLVAAQLKAFCLNWKQVDLSYARSKNLTPYDVLTIASMIEKEAIAPAERPLVAAVIYNRLHLQMPLQIDATLRYGLHIPPTRSITQSELASNSPYNTRHTQGLPPTPIANPGLASIRAAAHPAKVDYLYYVRKPDKIHHFFTASGAAFQQYECRHGYGC
jgi:uncharacterized YceG family protein